MKKSELKQIIREEISEISTQDKKKFADISYKNSKDYSQYEKSVAAFFNDNIQKMWTMVSDKEKLIAFIEDGLKDYSVSDKYMKTMINTIRGQKSTDKLMMYLGNIMLKGKGLGVGGSLR